MLIDILSQYGPWVAGAAGLGLLVKHLITKGFSLSFTLRVGNRHR
jgi:hypothetical protein